MIHLLPREACSGRHDRFAPPSHSTDNAGPLRNARVLRDGNPHVSEFLARLPEFIGNHPILSFGFVGVLLALLYGEFSRLTRGYVALTPAGLTQLINKDNALVVDVSAISDYEQGHIPGARHVAAGQFDPENKELAKVRDLPVAVVCKTGMASAQAARRLKKAGFSKVHWLEGGIGTWKDAQLPLAKGRAAG